MSALSCSDFPVPPLPHRADMCCFLWLSHLALGYFNNYCLCGISLHFKEFFYSFVFSSSSSDLISHSGRNTLMLMSSFFHLFLSVGNNQACVWLIGFHFLWGKPVRCCLPSWGLNNFISVYLLCPFSSEFHKLGRGNFAKQDTCTGTFPPIICLRMIYPFQDHPFLCQLFSLLFPLALTVCFHATWSLWS